jgi:hypothetical protein
VKEDKEYIGIRTTNSNISVSLLFSIETIKDNTKQELCTARLGLHVFTRYDTTSAFKGIGKVKSIKTLQKSVQFQSALAQIGDS